MSELNPRRPFPGRHDGKKRSVDAERLAELIGEAIARQTETDNLGDAESVVFVLWQVSADEGLAHLNLVEVAEALLAVLAIEEKTKTATPG